MLVSLAITLIMMGAVVTLFGTISDSVSGSRSIIEISERLRAARNRLQADLQGATATMKPPLRPENDEGYFEIIEGPMRDAEFMVETPPPFVRPIPPEYLQTALGDVDDVLMFTVRSRGEPFVGKFDTTTTESQVAEVMYFCAHAHNSAGTETDSALYLDNNALPIRTYTLYRRVLLVNPGLAASPTFNALQPLSDYPPYYDNYDVSARLQNSAGNWKLVPNSLGDLTKREFRFAHNGDFPFQLNAAPPVNVNGTTPTEFPNNASAYLIPFVPTGPRFGDDVLLTNVLSFDVQVYDPAAPVNTTATAALTPSDPGYAAGGPVLGAYADLGWDGPNTALLSRAKSRSVTPGGTVLLVPTLPIQIDTTAGPPFTISPSAGTPYTYDTWSMHYENNGINENAALPADTGTNGLDDNNNGIIDDPLVLDANGNVTGGEADTTAPFAAQLRGVRITIRVYEPSSQQVRQMTVVGDFLPD